MTPKNFLKNLSANPYILIGIMVSALYLGYVAGVSIEKSKYVDFLKKFNTFRVQSDKFYYINPPIGIISPSANEVGLYLDIRSEIVSYLDAAKKQGLLEDYSFYFRDINSSLWFGINEDRNFSPASLYKIPVALVIYKESEKNPELLQRKLVYSAEIAKKNKESLLSPPSLLEVGGSYSVEELVKIMLVQSDNGAKDLLLSVLNVTYLSKLFEIVSLANPTMSDDYKVSSQNYSFFFRVLYNGSYLNEENSELILSYLVNSSYKDALVAGIPPVVPAAHKFGIFDLGNRGIGINSIQLHDCGIVYLPGSPYIFCLMTKGKKSDVLAGVISQVSQIVYRYQNK